MQQYNEFNTDIVKIVNLLILIDYYLIFQIEYI